MTPVVPRVETAAEWLASRSTGPAPRGSVLLHAPSHVFQAPGGGENQLVQTGRYLEARGVVVKPFSPWADRLEEARLIHLFGMSREGLELARVARFRGLPVVLSPICWYDPLPLAALSGGKVAAVRDVAKWAVRRAWPRYPTWRRELLGLADAVVPNSRAEARQLVQVFAIDRGRVRVVPNGVEPRFAEASPDLSHDRFGADPFLLFVGRIEPRKNVLGLVRAARAVGLPLKAIGAPPPGQEGYFEECRRTSGSAAWLGALDHDDPLLASAYAAARVVALPSWFETPGLTALEAGLAGAAVVVTPYGSTREYFGDRVVYARPDEPGGVARALARAWENGADPRLAAHVAARFLWSEVARRTAEVYDEVAG